MKKQKVWFVTGASQGLGLELVKQLLSKGYSVAATSRSLASLQKALPAAGDSFLPIAMDITQETDVRKAIETTIAHFGQLDAVVNNAGYGLIGAVEELSDREARDNFEVNVFGSLNVIRQALPHLRQQQSGHVFNISSIGGFSGGFPAFGIYCATKFAVHGFTESLWHELKPFGVHVTLVMPGYFRTNFLTSGSLATPQTELAAYENVRQMQAAHQNDINAHQPGDPAKAANVLIELSAMATPPLHAFLGADAYTIADQKMALVQQEMAAFRQWGTSTNFAE